MEAFILEMFRHSSFLPFTIPHRYGLERLMLSGGFLGVVFREVPFRQVIL